MFSRPLNKSKNSIKLWLGVTSFTVYFLTAGGHFGSTDEEGLFQNTRHLAQIYGLSASPPQTAFNLEPLEVGQSVLALPFYWFGAWLSPLVSIYPESYTIRFVMTTFNLLITTLTVIVIYYLCEQFWKSRSIALISALLYGFATFAWPYSQTFFREPLNGLSLLVSFGAIYLYRQRQQTYYLTIAIGALFLALTTKITSLIALPWLLVYIGVSLPDNRRWQFITVILIGLVAIINLAIVPKVGTLQAYLYEIRYDLTHHSFYVIENLQGLLISPGKGIIFYAPPILLTLFALKPFESRFRLETIVIIGICLSYLLIYSTRQGWDGGLCWGPRYLLPILPLTILPIGALASSWYQQRLWYTMVVVFGIVGVMVQLGGVSIYHGNYYREALRAQPPTWETSTSAVDLQKFYLSWDYFPVAGQFRLSMKRVSQLVNGYGYDGFDEPMPTEAYQLWVYFIRRNRLDFWWLP